MMRTLSFLVVLLSSGVGLAGPREDHAAKMAAVEQEYYRLSGTKRVLEDTKLEKWHALSTAGDVYLVAARREDKSIVGPFYLIEAIGTNVSEYKIDLPDPLIAVFGETEWGRITGADGHALESVSQTFSVPITKYEDKLRLYLSLSGGRPLLPPVSVKGQTQSINDGWRLPWQGFSLSDIELTELTNEEFSPYVPLALLNEDGTVFAGEFSPRSMMQNLPDATEVADPISRLQRLYYSIFYPLAENEREHARRFEGFSTEAQTSGIDFQLEMEGEKPVRLTPTEILVESIGLARGPHAFSEHILQLRVEFLEGAAISVGFQNNLPDLLDRSIYFASNRGRVSNYQEPVQVWFQKAPAGTKMISTRGTPVRDGTIKVREFDVAAGDGLLTGLRAELTFATSVISQGQEVNARGILRFALPKDSLLPPYADLTQHDIRVHRPDHDDFYPKETPDNNRYSCPGLLVAR